MMHFSSLLSSVLLAVSLIVPALSKQHFEWPGVNWDWPPLPLPVGVIHQFPVGTWVESLAIRNNGKILTTALSSPEIVQVDNRGVQPNTLVHTFANATACTGIVHMGKDVFYVIAGNFTLSTLTPVPGSWSVYKVDVRHRHPHLTKPKPARVSWLANIPDAVFLKGIMVLNKRHETFLLTDSGAGRVYRLEGKTGQVMQVMDDPLMKPDGSASYGVGISGLRIQKHTNWFYFTNLSRGILARIRIDKDHGTPKDDSLASVVTHLDGPDEFIFNDWHHVLVAQNGVDHLGRVVGSKVTMLAGGPPNGTAPTLYGPTAVRLGKVRPILRASKKDWQNAYITTNGGTGQYVTGNVTRGGTISAVDVRGYD